MVELIKELEENYGTVEYPKESITEKGLSIISYIENNNIISKTIDKTSPTKTTIISTTPIDFSIDLTTLEDCGEQVILPYSQIDVIEEQGETEDFVSKRTTTHYPDLDAYNLNKPESSLSEITKNINGVLVNTDITRKYNQYSNNVYFVEVHKHYIDDLSYSSISDSFAAEGSKLIKHYSKKTTLENTTDTDFELTEETANYKTIEKDLNFVIDSPAQKSLFHDTSFKEYVKSQNGEYHILNQSTRVVKRGDIDEFLVEDDNLIFVSGDFLTYLQHKNIVDETESITTLKQYADELGATSLVITDDSDAEFLSEDFNDYSM